MYNIIQILLAVLLIAAILLQNRGSGLGATFGGDGNVFRTKRGVEKKLYTFTIVLSAAFLSFAFINTFV